MGWRSGGRSRRRSKRRSFGNLQFEPLLARLRILIVGVQLQNLIVLGRISALLVNGREFVPVFVVHSGGFLKEINCFVPVLAFSGLSALAGESIRFGIFFLRCLAYL